MIESLFLLGIACVSLAVACYSLCLVIRTRIRNHDEECGKKFMAEKKEKGLKITWLVRCHDCEEDNDIETILSNDNPGRPIACPKCEGKSVDIILKGVMEA